MINLSQPQLSSWAVWRFVHASKQSCVPQQSSGHQGGRAHPGLLGHLDTPGLQITWGCPMSCWRMFSPYPPFSSLALDVLPSFLPFLTCLWISTFLQLWSTLRLVGFSVSHPQTHTHNENSWKPPQSHTMKNASCSSNPSKFCHCQLSRVSAINESPTHFCFSLW